MVDAEYTYDPFGRTTVTGTVDSNSFQYTSRENDGTGLYFYRARYYHPSLQRFIGEDPLEFGGGDYNLYAYVQNSPLLLRDPLGLVVTCGPVASRPGGWKSRGDTFWRFRDTEGPEAQGMPYGPLICYWDLVAPGWDITINYRICSDSCKKVDWMEEVSRTELESERIMIRGYSTFARPYLMPGPYKGVSGRPVCDTPPLPR